MMVLNNGVNGLKAVQLRDKTHWIGWVALSLVLIFLAAPVANAAPPAATLTSPSGNISDTTPTYTWNAVSDSTWYYLWVNDSTGNKAKTWYTASDAGCSLGSGTCSVTPSTTLAQGAGQWWIRTWNDSGYGPWSSASNFTVGSNSAGCGNFAITGQRYVGLTSSDTYRRYYLSVPNDYDPNRAYPLVFGYHGTNWDGIRMRDYLRLETTAEADNMIFVYPDALTRYWPEWNWTAGGWLTGQSATNEDYIFFDDILSDVGNNHCIDLSRVYVTGQSWGGDMASSLPCARGNKIAAATSVAANTPHYFEGFYGYENKYPAIQPGDCQRPVPMITYRGAGDTYQSGAVSDWWYDINQCTQPAGGYANKESILTIGRYEDQSCAAPNIYVRYTNIHTTDHQIPVQFEDESITFFLQHVLNSAGN
jgi:poly(3-hydroxybutyrate) depolymerase